MTRYIRLIIDAIAIASFLTLVVCLANVLYRTTSGQSPFALVTLIFAVTGNVVFIATLWVLDRRSNRRSAAFLATLGLGIIAVFVVEAIVLGAVL